jgi:hypothetical protein
VTGAHTVGDISCAHCGSVLGWKYIAAENEEQKYKVGKFILETKRVCRSSRWEDETRSPFDEDEIIEGMRRDSIMRRRRGSACGSSSPPPMELKGKEGGVEFDSDDEDECEALFLGLWTPQTAMKLRRNKAREMVRNAAMME